MTREEAIKNLVAYAYYVDEPMPEEVAKSIDMAIEALSVDLVRCGECMWQDKGENECEAWNLCALRGYTPTSDNHFCSYGERRSDD